MAVEPKQSDVNLRERGAAAAIDPTKNVLDLVEAAVTRIDDMAGLRASMQEKEIAHAKEIAQLRAENNTLLGKLREEYQEKVSRAESSRLDSIRQVDREEVAKTAVAANTAITTLAKQTNDLAVTLAKTVADTAAAAEARNSAQYSDTNKRLSALELSSSEGKGKQQVADPQLERLTQQFDEMLRNQERRGGKQDGMSDSRQFLTWLLGIALALTTLYTFAQRGSPQPAPQIIYTPAPPGTQLPSSPPVTVPR